ncbi:hypothetical protein [Aquimarina latercula]|uniref:hypothetical protein n=1 Tax=Aquimarina latercula TaxID=987 RepID=UPI0003F6EF01|nr:hypothetical protein [Aquimarina latercula]
MGRKTTLSLILLFIFRAYSQDITVKSDQLVSDDAFNKLIFQDLNFMILGDNAPQQGLAFELNDKQTQIAASGYLGNYKSAFFTIDGAFSVDNGVYFFDENGGSKQSKFTVNTYIPRGNAKRGFPSLQNKVDKHKLKRAFIKRNFNIHRDIPLKLYTYKGLYNLMLQHNLPVESDTYYSTIIAQVEEYDSSIVIDRSSSIDPIPVPAKSKYKLKTPRKRNKLIIENTRDWKKGETYNLDPNFDVLKLIADYEKAKADLDSLIESTKDKEIEITRDIWTSKTIDFFGISAFYQRESTTLYNFEENMSFNSLFSDIIGDLYGITGSYNYTKQWKGQRYFIFRGLASFSRGSNIGAFRQSTINLNTPTGDIIDGEPVTITNSRTGYVGEGRYTYGFRQGYDVEVYYSFFKSIGIFGNIGYDKLGFSDESNLESIETFPMRIGALLNLKSKDKQKNILTLQVFIDRQDLNKEPNGDDKDLRFGFKVGLPINIGKKL